MSDEKPESINEWFTSWGSLQTSDGSLSATDLEEVYGTTTWGSIEPNVWLVSPQAYTYIKQKFSDPSEPEPDDFDEFADWAQSVRHEAKQPHNKQLRQFLEGPNRWRNRGHR